MNIQSKNLLLKFVISLVSEQTLIEFNVYFTHFLCLESAAELVYKDPVVDDPQQRRPDITLAKSWLNWSPKVISIGKKNSFRTLFSDFLT